MSIFYYECICKVYYQSKWFFFVNKFLNPGTAWIFLVIRFYIKTLIMHIVSTRSGSMDQLNIKSICKRTYQIRLSDHIAKGKEHS